jgi:hypothetical protein
MVDPTIQPMLPKVIAAVMPQRIRWLIGLFAVVIILVPHEARIRFPLPDRIDGARESHSQDGPAKGSLSDHDTAAEARLQPRHS